MGIITTRFAMKNSNLKLKNNYLASVPGSTGLCYIRHVDNDTLKTDKDEYVQSFEISGRSLTTLVNSEANSVHAALSGSLYALARDNVALWTHIIREPESGYPEGSFKSAFSKKLDTAYRERVTRSTMYSTRIFISVIVRTSDGDKINKAASKAVALTQPQMMLKVRAISDTIMSSFRSYSIKQLGLYQRDEMLFSRPAELLGRLYNGFWQPVPLGYKSISEAIPTVFTIFSKEVVEVRDIAESRYGGAIGVLEYPDPTRPGMLDELLSLQFPFILTQSFVFVSKNKAIDRMELQERRMDTGEDHAGSQAIQISDALDDLASGNIAMGMHHLSLISYSDSINALNRNLSRAASAVRDAGFAVAREYMALEAHFWAQFPGNYRDVPTAAMITTRNFAAMNTFNNKPSGSATGNHWGSAVAKFKTDADTPYYMNFHVEDIGHASVFGMTGSGKTVTMNFLMSQCDRFDPQLVAFDKDRGSEIFIRASGGLYSALKVGVPTGLNPLQLEPTARNLAFIKTWLKQLATGIDNSLFSIEDGEKIDFAVNSLIEHTALKERRLSSLIQFFPDVDENSLAHRLRPWCHGGEYGWMFDNPEDSLNLNNKMLGFDMTEFLDDPTIRTPLLMYLFHRVRSLIDGRRFIMLVDEAWKALNDEYFKSILADFLATIRKLNGMVIFGTQSPSTAVNSSIANILLEQTATTLLTANPKAKKADYMKLGLSEKEFAILRTHDLKSHKIMVKQGDECAIVKLDLFGMNEALAVLSGTATNVEILDTIRAKVGDDPADWMPHFLEEVRT
ncbi:MAG: VirB4 family type IV secretion/conjugal transfer ATPase [Methylococcaceae bacterium]